jgi:hypothetical protein
MAQVGRKPVLRHRLAEGYQQLRQATGSAAGAGRAASSLVIAVVDGLMLQALVDPERAADVAAELEPLLDLLERRLVGAP